MSDVNHPTRPFFIHKYPLNIAHRGGAALAPENTLLAFERGIAAGADVIELDLQMTRDGELIISHDTTVQRTTNGSGSIAQFTLAELKRLDAGYHFTADHGKSYPFRNTGVVMPTLRDVFDHFPAIRMNIGFKRANPLYEQQLWLLLQEYNASDRVLIGSLFPSATRFRNLTKGRVATSASPAEVCSFFLKTQFHATSHLTLGYDSIQIPAQLSTLGIVTPSAIAMAHRSHAEIHVWTVNREADMRHLLDLGVDGIMTNHPDILAKMLSARSSLII